MNSQDKNSGNSDREPSWLGNIIGKITGNVRSMAFNRREAAGSLGDLGTFIPLLAAMVTINGIDLGSALIFGGLFNIITGVMFGIPMAVQPMKAIAAVAISEGLTPPQILAAGIVTGGVVFLFGVTRLIELFNRVIPLSVVRGLQLGLGITLAIKGVTMVIGTDRFFGFDSIFLGIVSGILVLLLFFSKRFPGALVVFALGLAMMIFSSPDLLTSLRPGLYLPKLVHFSLNDFSSGFFMAAIPQIPLTTLNSVIAVCALSYDLYPNRGVGTRQVSVSVGLMNLIGCWFGAMPMCHGSGGLAGQHRFGARTGGSVVFLGLVKLAIGLFFGASAIALLVGYPLSVLGILLIFSGMELCMVTRDMKSRKDYFIMVLSAATIIGFSSTSVGFVTGIGLAYIIRIGKFMGHNGDINGDSNGKKDEV